MKLHINVESRIRNIQSEFNALYPFLKIEFCKSLSNKNKALPCGETISPGTFVKAVGRINGYSKIDISEQRTVSQLEEDFKKFFGLDVQVYRKSKGVWIKITLTNNWTLEQQNKEGELIGA